MEKATKGKPQVFLWNLFLEGSQCIGWVFIEANKRYRLSLLAIQDVSWWDFRDPLRHSCRVSSGFAAADDGFRSYERHVSELFIKTVCASQSSLDLRLSPLESGMP